MDADDNTIYTVLVIPSTVGDTILTLKTGSVTDLADPANKLVGDQAHTYVPPMELQPAEITSPAGGNVGDTTAGATITITFNKDPGTVTADGTALTGTGTARTVTAGAASGSISLTWTGDASVTSDDGSGTITYTIPVFVSLNPTSPANITMFEIPANSYIVLVRAMSGEGALEFPTVPPVNGTAVDVRVWSDMPDLHELFQRTAQNRGGAIVLRKSADARDNDMQDAAGMNIGMYATPGVGSVGISEIMWARDLKHGNADDQAAGQWIELQNLNSKPVKVLIYAQKGSEGLVSGGVLVNTSRVSALILRV